MGNVDMSYKMIYISLDMTNRYKHGVRVADLIRLQI